MTTSKEFYYSYENKNYLVKVTFKRIKNIVFRFRDNVFYISAPFLTSEKRMRKGLDMYATKLVSYDHKKQDAVKENEITIFGETYPYYDRGIITLKDGINLKYLDKEDLLDKVKTIYFEYMLTRTRYYEKMMNITKPYRVRLRKMSTRFGTNSKKTYTITYADHLFSYSYSILDTLIVHELVHHYVFNHSPSFYQMVIKYCPNYVKENNKLKKRIYR